MSNDKHLAELKKLSVTLSSKFKSAEDRLTELTKQHAKLTKQHDKPKADSSGDTQQNGM